MLPICIFTLSDRGAIFDASTLAMILGTATLVMPPGLSRIASKGAVH